MLTMAWMHRAIHGNSYIKPRDKNEPEVTYPADVTKAIEDSLPFYEKLYSAKITVLQPFSH